MAMVSHNRHPESYLHLLAELAGLYGVQRRYRDTRGRWRESPAESVVAVLRALGAEVDAGSVGGNSALTAAIRVRKRELRNRIIEPALVAWDGVLASPVIRPSEAQGRSEPPGRTGRSGPRLTLTLEDGSVEQWEVSRDTAESSPNRRLLRLPCGYHRLLLETGGATAEVVVISAPRRCWMPEPERSRRVARADFAEPAVPKAPSSNPLDVPEGRPWGIFAPLYALRSERDWGAGDLADLHSLRDWVGARGGSVVSTLPLLASFLDDPFEPAPYRPVSRLFWNEFYLAVEQIGEWEECAAARELWGAADTATKVHALRAAPLVDYRAVMALKRQVLEKLAEWFFTQASSGRREAFAGYLRQHPHAEEYAAFRAGQEGHSAGESAAAARYHLYCQWQIEEQLSRLSSEEGPGLSLDLPLGVHPGGFDTWRWPELFAKGMSAGAPPDGFFSRGQVWDFPPLRPERTREGGHGYFAACLRNHMRHARYLRIDHVMSLHRLFWVPDGREPTDGVYVSYPAEESYAVLCLESHRYRTMVVGEDLGTVPAGVRSAMRRHGLLRTWVLQSALRPRAADTVASIPRDAVASLNTHDMFPFAGFLRGDDISARLETGQLDPERARRETAARRHLVERLATSLPALPKGLGPATVAPVVGKVAAEQAGLVEAEVLWRALIYMATSPAALVTVNLEDLLLETRPQNLPGTGAEQPNWRRKSAQGLESLRKDTL